MTSYLNTVIAAVAAALLTGCASAPIPAPRPVETVREWSPEETTDGPEENGEVDAEYGYKPAVDWACGLSSEDEAYAYAALMERGGMSPEELVPGAVGDLDYHNLVRAFKACGIGSPA